MSVIAAGLRGGRGDPGLPFRVDKQGTLAERANYNTQLAGFTYLATDNGYLYFKESLPGAWSAGMLFRGPAGPRGGGITLLGSLASVDQLPATGIVGNAWMIAGHAWVWNGSAWEDAGQIQGDKGEPGINGVDGRSIATLAINDQGRLIATYTDESTQDAGQARGADGTGITSVAINGSNRLLVTLSTGAVLDAGQIATLQGRGISSAVVNLSGNLIVTYTDGATADVGHVVGTDGDDGIGIASMSVNGTGHLIVTLTSGTVLDAGQLPVLDGVGADGKGIAGVSFDANGHLIITYTDTTTQDAGALPTGEEVAALQAQVQSLLERIATLEGYHAVPTNVLTDQNGAHLTDQNGNYLTFGVAA
ncbi:hypothetical protein SAMN05216229_102121 [Geopseudomonas sagittaria]|uniref:Uncharacterized protein n=1 Tax=Geopseudomonas sagittaria TaxID=1135990 RepID=A0A1I5PZL0_9GAMM|nr:hypothetical protein [Pseudomonas sagittaria]SFP39503.1 hypothetical protein SAMN05216229_102121 [Pseudomonas sagittaria]